MTIRFKFAREAYKARMREGLTQAQVAEAVGISVRWYQRIESGARFPGSVLLIRLILLLHIDVELFREEVGLIAVHTA